VVEEESRAPPQVSLPALLVNFTFPEEFSQRLEVSRTMHGDEIILPNENIHLAGLCYAIFLVKYGEMKDYEQVVFIFVYFGALYAAKNVIQIKRMEIETLG
jgi:hypothetical protein